MRAVAYLRVSTAGQVEHGFSIGDQEHAIRAHCERAGYELIEVVVDGGESGRLADRPGLLKLYRLADERAFDVCVALNLKRLGRENRLIQNALHALRSRRIGIEFVEHNSGDTPADRLLLNVLGGVAEFEWEEFRRRSKSGKAEKARTGRVPTGPIAYGYRIIRKWEANLPEWAGRDGEILVEEREAAVVRELFRRYAGGEPLRDLCRWLNDAGIRTRAGRLWLPSTLRAMLANETYVGRYYYGKEQTRELDERTKGGRKKVESEARPRDEWTLIACPALIEAGTFAQAQERLAASRMAAGGRRNPDAALSGLAFCSVCTGRHGPLSCRARRTGHNAARPGYWLVYYTCTSMDNPLGREYCGTHVPARQLEPLVYRRALRLTEPGKGLRKLAEEAVAARQRQAGDVGGRIRLLEREAEELDLQEGRVADLILSGISRRVVEGRLGAIRARRLALERELAEARALLGRAGDPEEAGRKAEALAAELRRELLAAKDDPPRLRATYARFLRVWLHPSEKPRIEVLDHVLGA